jgi:hypothetical protein
MQYSHFEHRDPQHTPDVPTNASVAVAVVDASGTLKLVNHGWSADGRSRQVPRVLHIKPGAQCMVALRILAQSGNESAQHVLQAVERIRSGAVHSIRCECQETDPEVRLFDVTFTELRYGGGFIITSIDVTSLSNTFVRELFQSLLTIRTTAATALNKLERTKPNDPALLDAISAITRASTRGCELASLIAKVESTAIA